MDETADAPRIMTEHGRGTLTGEAARSAFRRSGYLCVEGALDPTFCRATIGTLAQASMVAVASQDLRGVTRFLTLNGEELLARAPRLGEHTRSVLREFAGLSEGEIDTLVGSGVALVS